MIVYLMNEWIQLNGENDISYVSVVFYVRKDHLNTQLHFSAKAHQFKVIAVVDIHICGK